MDLFNDMILSEFEKMAAASDMFKIFSYFKTHPTEAARMFSPEATRSFGAFGKEFASKGYSRSHVFAGPRNEWMKFDVRQPGAQSQRFSWQRAQNPPRNVGSVTDPSYTAAMGQSRAAGQTAAQNYLNRPGFYGRNVKPAAKWTMRNVVKPVAGGAALTGLAVAGGAGSAMASNPYESSQVY